MVILYSTVENETGEFSQEMSTIPIVYPREIITREMTNQQRKKFDKGKLFWTRQVLANRSTIENVQVMKAQSPFYTLKTAFRHAKRGFRHGWSGNLLSMIIFSKKNGNEIMMLW